MSQGVESNSDFDSDAPIVSVRGRIGTELDVQISELTSVVATRSNVIGDYSHIRSFGQGLSGSEIRKCCLPRCDFDSRQTNVYASFLTPDIQSFMPGVNPVCVDRA